MGASIAYADRREVSWKQAISLLEANKVKRVVQSHALEVLLDLKDGSGLRTVEPATDEIPKIIERCAPRCDPVLYLTE